MTPAGRPTHLLLASFAALTSLLAIACGPEAVDGPRKYLVYDRAADGAGYRLAPAEITTLEDVESGFGSVARLRGGGQIRAGTEQPSTAQGLRDALKIEGATTPDLDYTLREDDVVVPWDFHSAMMLTLYHHLEVAHRYFVGLGVDPDSLGQVPVYYSVQLQFILPINLFTDNAAYAFTEDAFLVPPRLLLKDVPLAANRGVIVHEYGHRVMNRLVHGGKRAPDYLVEPWSDAHINRMKALEEGIADIFAGLQTGDPNFIRASISEERFDIDRDLSKERHFTEELADSIEATDPSAFNPYEVGSVIASTLWTLRPSLSDEQLGRALVRALRDFGEVDPPFTLTRFFDLLHARLPEDARSDACELFRARLDAIKDELSCSM